MTEALLTELAELAAAEPPGIADPPGLLTLARPQQQQYQQQQQQQQQQAAVTDAWESAKWRAVDVSRRLDEADRAAHRPKLAAALRGLGRLLNRRDRPGAREVTAESVALYRELAESDDGYMLQLAGALDELAIFQKAEGRSNSAIASASEAVDTYRRLGQAHEVALAGALNNLAVLLSASQLTDGALACSRESVALYRAHAADDQVTQRLVTALINHAGLAAFAGFDEEADAATAEAHERHDGLYRT